MAFCFQCHCRRRSQSAPPKMKQSSSVEPACSKLTRTTPTIVASANLADENRKLLPVIKDGNSFFRSVSRIFSGHEMHYMKWRKVLVSFESLFPDHIFHTDMADPSVRYIHVQSMLLNRTPATEFELIGLATMVQCQLYVYDMISRKPSKFIWRVYMPRFSCEQLYENGYLTMYREGNVYGLITDMHGSSTRNRPEAVSRHRPKNRRAISFH